MSKFLSKLVIEPSDDQASATLVYPLRYQCDPLRMVVIVPEGFQTDFASIPRAFWNIFPPFGSYGEPAIVHDYLYRVQQCTRAEADAVFLDAMTAKGVGWFTRHTIYRAVRWFGWAAWNNNAKAKESYEEINRLS